MQNIIKLFTLLIFGVLTLQAQENQVVYKTQDFRSYSQFNLYIGYNIPLSDPDFGVLEYKGDLATGISFHNFWNWIGVQADIGYTFTNIDSQFNERVNYQRDFGGGLPVDSDIQYYDSYKDKLKQLFLGAGPTFKYQSKNDKFVIDAGVMAGVGIAQKGSYLQYGVDENFNDFYGLAVAYHSGFDRNGKFALKPNLNFNYFFRPDFGIFLGTHYTHFFSAEEADGNDLLTDYNFQNLEDTYYYFEPIIEYGDENPTTGLRGNLVGIDIPRSGSQENKGSFDLSAVQIVAGLTWKINRVSTEKRCPAGYVLCPNDGLCYEDGNCGEVPSNNIIVSVLDKISNQPIQNVQVELIDQVSKATIGEKQTESQGLVKYADVENGDYTIEGNLEDAQFSTESVSQQEFNNTDKIEKTIYYMGSDFMVNGLTSDCGSNNVLSNASIKFVNTQNAQSYQTTSDENGNYSLLLPKGNYVAEIQKEAYFSERKDLNLQTLDRKTQVGQTLNLCAQKLECNQQLKFQNLLFDLDDYHLTPNSTNELDNLAAYLNTNSEVQLEIYSYTDSRGSKAYNKNLSQKRAEETVKYLVSKGVSRTQLTAKGYGEENLLNNCADGVECTESEHSINRRTEFKVVCP